MNITDWLISAESTYEPLNLTAVLLSLLLAFICGQIIAWIYMYTHSGLSYSRTYVNSLVVIPFLVAMVMAVLSNNLVTAFGLMALFAIVRFRNILRDTLDTCYILSAITLGMACGTQRYATAVIGLVLVSGILIYLWACSFGSRHRYDLVLNLHWGRPLTELADLQALLRRHSRRTECASQRSNGNEDGTDLSYRLLLRDPGRMDELFAEVKQLAGASRVTGLVAQEQSEL
jgi:hypothetical protein